MQLSDQVCSLELSIHLKELGVKQISIFCWSESETIPIGRDYRLYYKGDNGGGNKLDYSAFTAAELGDLLKDKYISFPYYINNKGWGVWNKSKFVITGHTEADARAKMLVYLLENELIK